MSYVGGDFEYDVFVSYSHGSEEPELRDWSRYVTNRLSSSLSIALNRGQDKERHFRMFRDDREIVSGAPLTLTLEAAAKRSAVLLVVLIPSYATKKWCLDELGWFLEKANTDGRGTQYCQPIQAVPLESSEWPESLLDGKRTPVAYENFVDEPQDGGAPTDLPVGLENPSGNAALGAKIIKVHSQILGKLKTYRKILDSTKKFDSVGSPAVVERPVIFLRARQEARTSWSQAWQELKPCATVCPTTFPAADYSDPLFLNKRRERLTLLANSNADALLRTGPAEANDELILSALQDRKELRARGLEIPWGLVDKALIARSAGPDQQIPLEEQLAIPRIPGDSPDWPSDFMRALGLNSSSRGGPNV